MFISISIVTVLYAENEKICKVYEIQSGEVIYEISGESPLTSETNLSIAGEGRLRFKEWGDVVLLEEKGEISIQGALKDRQVFQRLIKQEQDITQNADYKTQKVLERKTSDRNIVFGENTKDGLKQTGDMNITGLKCEVWEGPGIKKCLYKGMPLLIEIDLYGIRYSKKALEVKLDINASEEECSMPDFPVEEFGLIKNSVKTKNKEKSKKIFEILKDISRGQNFGMVDSNETNETNESMDKVKTEFINQFAQSIFEHQKKRLPELLGALKKSRECIERAEHAEEANACLDESEAIKKELGMQTSYANFWDDNQTHAYGKKLDDEIFDLESRMSCIGRAQNIIELSACMK